MHADGLSGRQACKNPLSQMASSLKAEVLPENDIISDRANKHQLPKSLAIGAAFLEQVASKLKPLSQVNFILN